MIGVHNYEIWFLDYWDGNLSIADQELLFIFLEKYPALKVEFDWMGEPEISVTASDKNPVSLHKRIIPVGEISDSTYETYFIAHHEGDLSENESEMLHVFLHRNPFLEKELALYGNIKLVDSAETCPNKDGLKRTVFSFWMVRYAVAASFLFLLGVGISKLVDNETNKSGVIVDNNIVQKVRHSEPKKETRLAVEKKETLVSVERQAVSSVKKVKEVVSDEKKSAYVVEAKPIETVSALEIQPIYLLVREEQEMVQMADLPQTMKEEEIFLSIPQFLGDVLAKGIGENGLSEELRAEKNNKMKTFIELLAVPFRKSKNPVLQTSSLEEGEKRVNVKIGIFEADFALK